MTDNKTITITLAIDCDPMNRCQEILGRMIFGDILRQEYREPNNTFFGCWTWCGVKCTKEQQREIKKTLVNEYNDGNIRYAEFGEQH